MDGLLAAGSEQHIREKKDYECLKFRLGYTFSKVGRSLCVSSSDFKANSINLTFSVESKLVCLPTLEPNRDSHFTIANCNRLA